MKASLFESSTTPTMTADPTIGLTLTVSEV
jgi:hypothetical protein